MAEANGGSKADTLVKVVLVFFISLLSFSVGTFVGKQVSDSDHRNLALESEYGKGGRKVASVGDKDDDDETEGGLGKISEKEVDNLTEEFLSKEKSRAPAQAKAEDAAADEAEGKYEKTAKVAAEPVKESVAEEPKAAREGYTTYARGAKEKPAEESAEAPVAKNETAAPDEDMQLVPKESKEAKGAKAPKEPKAAKEPKVARAAVTKLPSVASSAVGKFTVQVASYADEAEAKEYVSRLKERGFTAFYLGAKVKSKTWYRVQVGLFDSVKSADEYKIQVNKELGGAMPIIQKIVQ